MKTSQNLKQAIRDHLDEVQLDDQQIQILNRLQANHQNNTRRGFLKWAMAACALIATLFISMQYFNNRIVLSKIAGEIAQNHIQHGNIKFQSKQFEMISRHFDELDVKPKLPDDLSDLSDQNLLGARYCSIHGSIALQLRYGENIIDSAALYIASPGTINIGKLKNQLSQYNNRYVTRIDNVDVQLWYEQGLLYAISQQN